MSLPQVRSLIETERAFTMVPALLLYGSRYDAQERPAHNFGAGGVPSVSTLLVGPDQPDPRPHPNPKPSPNPSPEPHTVVVMAPL